VTTYVYRHGHNHKVSDLVRGSMLVHSVEEWSRRSESLIKARRKPTIPSLIVLVILFTLLVVLLHPATSPWLVLLAFSTLGFAEAAILDHHMIQKSARDSPMGLYEGGVILIFDVLIPYSDIKRLEIDKRSLGELNVILQVKDWYRRGELVPFRVPFDFLGEEGMRELESRVSSAHPSAGGR